MLVLFRRLVTPTPDSPLSPYIALLEYYDDVKRTVYRQQVETQTNNPTELPVDTELARYAVRPGTARVVRYGGEGQIYTQDEGVTAGPGGGGVCTLDAPYVVPSPAEASNASALDATFSVTGYLGAPPYTITVRAQNSPTVLLTRTSASTLQPAQFTGLGVGRFIVTIADAAGCARTAPLDVFVANTPGSTYGPNLRVTYSYNNGLFRIFWNPRTKMVETEQTPGPLGNPNDPDYDDITPVNSPVDGYMDADGYTWIAVFSNGQGDVYKTYSDTRKPGLLELNNLILFHPDSIDEYNGGVLVECNASDYPLSFQLNDGAGSALGAPNASGRFDGLSADSYEVVVTDAEGRTLSVPFQLRARYGKRWQLTHDDVRGTPYRAELWQLAYIGPVGTLKGQGGAPVEIRTDGLSGATGGQGDVPAAVGTSCVLNLRAPVGELEDVQLSGPQAFRLDVYYDGALAFRGYVTPDVYTAPLLPGLVEVSLTATDGLADLKDVDFTGHIGQPLTGRWPVFNTLAHCLSRTDMALPVRMLTHRWPLELPTVSAPELRVLTERAGYQDDKGKPLDCRTVVEALAQLLGGTLVQRGGAWEIRSAMEAAATVAARVYAPAGTSRPAVTVAAPAGTILPPQRLNGPGWRWGEASQQLSIRAGWKSLAATTDAGYATNALPAGDAFGSDAAWNRSLDALLPTAGWTDNAAEPGFPLLLVRAGEKNTDLGTRWPRVVSLTDARYLQSGLLPNSTQLEDVPWALAITARLVIPTVPGQPAPVITPGDDVAMLRAEMVIDGQRPLAPLVFSFKLPGESDTTLSVPLPPIPAGAKIVRLRLYPWDGPAIRTTAELLIKKVAIQLQPQGATWDGKDNFRADGPAGTVRPTEPVNVFHCDVPLKAGLFEGNAYAFRRAVTVAGGALTTNWQRPGDERAAPLLESAAYDGLALRARPSRLLTGPVHYAAGVDPPRVLDAVDAPYDLNGRRFWVGACTWNLRKAIAEVSLVEIGEGATVGAFDPYEGLPAGVRILDGVWFPTGAVIVPGRGRPRVRATHHGLRIARQG